MLARVIESYSDFYKLDLSFISATGWLDILETSFLAGYSKAVKRILSLGQTNGYFNRDQKRLRKILISNAPLIVQSNFLGLLAGRYRPLKAVDVPFWKEFISQVAEFDHDKVWRALDQESPRLLDLIEPFLHRNVEEQYPYQYMNSELLNHVPNQEIGHHAVGIGSLPLQIHRPRLPPLRALAGQPRRISMTFPRLHV
jgi:hypothetical protein